MAVIFIVKSSNKQDKFEINESNPEIIIGRSSKCNISVDDQKCSGKHCKLYTQNKKFYVKDLDSKNGTFCGNIQIKSDRPIYFEDEIKIGNTIIKMDIAKLTPVEKATLSRKNTSFKSGITLKG